jgi:predicted enzyme related to lactoylglutathione lyase
MTLTFDCTDAVRLAGFWSDVLGRPVDPDASGEFATIGAANSAPGPSWMFIKVPEPKQLKNRVHVDLSAENMAAEIDRLVALGATRLGEFDESGARWTTLADPEGNEFDVVEGSH